METEEGHREAARRVFEAWARRLPRMPNNTASLIRRIETSNRRVGRLVTHVEGRRIAWATKPYRGRQSLGEPPDVGDADPWTVDPDDLKKRSHHYAQCHTCGAVGKVACGVCQGTGRVACEDCGGLGRVQSQASNRMINCRRCRGSASMKCADCARGQVACPGCQGAKKLESWLIVDPSSREDVQIEPDGAATAAFTWGHDGVSADESTVEADARILSRASGSPTVDPDEAQRADGNWFTEHWAGVQPRTESGERPLKQTFQLIEIPTAAVTYGFGPHEQTIALEGRRLLAPPPVFDVLAHRRARTLAWSSGLLVAAALTSCIVIAVLASPNRSELAAWAAGLLAIAGVAGYWAISRRSLGRRALPAALAAGGAFAGAIALAFIAKPSVGAARDYIEAGDLDRAKAELEATSAPNDSAEWADIRLTETLAASDLSSATKAASLVPAGTAQAERAATHVDTLAIATAMANLERGNTNGTREALAIASERVRDSAEGRRLRDQAALHDARACLARSAWDCALTSAPAHTALQPEFTALRTEAVSQMRADATSKAQHALTLKDTGAARAGALAAALTAWTAFESVSGEKLPGREKFDAALARADKDRARDERAAARAAERQAQAEARRQRAEERRQRARDWANQPLQCCDGTSSPSCTRGGSHRGCCSRHGGVCD